MSKWFSGDRPGALLNVLPDGQDWNQVGLSPVLFALSLSMTPLTITPNMGKQEIKEPKSTFL